MKMYRNYNIMYDIFATLNSMKIRYLFIEENLSNSTTNCYYNVNHKSYSLL